MKQIPLSRGLFALVDDADFYWLAQWKWCAIPSRTKRTFYAVRTDRSGPRQTTVQMHRVIAGASKGLDVDHRNHNGLDNQRDNLRTCEHAKNTTNKNRYGTGYTSKYKGVVWHKATQKWLAQIGHRGRREHLGLFLSEVAAARAYQKRASELFGEFAEGVAV